MTFEQAKAKYVHRFTMEHIPNWAKKPLKNETYYAPQYRSDAEWFKLSVFPPNNPLSKTDCCSMEQTWPLGLLLDKPYKLRA
jgi:hypothetical protein